MSNSYPLAPSAGYGRSPAPRDRVLQVEPRAEQPVEPAGEADLTADGADREQRLAT